MSAFRLTLKVAAESMLASGPAFVLARHLRRGSRLVLAYHDVVSDDEPSPIGESSLHLPLTMFRRQLDALDQLGFRVVEAGAPLPVGDRSPEAAITFDDAYSGAVRLGVPELARRGLPATIFVAPGLLGTEAPWWDRLADPFTGEIAEPIRTRAIVELAGEEHAILARAASSGWGSQRARSAFAISTEEALRQALALHPGLTLGAHTWSHANVVRLDGDRLDEELRRPLDWLRASFPDRTLPWMAYPYGLESEQAREAVARVGYTDAFLVRGGWLRGDAPRLALPRFNVTPGLSLQGFRLRLAGYR